MPKNFWWKRNSAESISEAFREATVDAHEQCVSIFNTIDEELEFPFDALVVGETVTVVGIEQSGCDSLGLDLICEKAGKRYSVAARSIELSKNLPERQVFLAAYLDWKSKF